MKKWHYDEIPFKRRKNESYRFDYRLIKKRKRFLNMIVCPREMGKGYGAKVDLVIDNWVKNKHPVTGEGLKTLWLRRNQTQVDQELEKDFWTTTVETYKEKYNYDEDLEVEQDGNLMYINGEIAVEFHSLSAAVKLKGPQYVGYNQIVLDEFLEARNFMYLTPAQKEPTDYFLKMMSTFFRDNDIEESLKSMWLIGNSEQLVNPYFAEFGIIDKINIDTEWLISDLICVWFPRMSLALEKDMMSMDRNKLISRTSYAKVALNNEFFDANPVNIEPRLFPNSTQLFSFQQIGVTIHFYLQEDKEKKEKYTYISGKGSTAKTQYVAMASDITNETEVKIPINVLRQIRKMIQENQVKYSDARTRAIALEYFDRGR